MKIHFRDCDVEVKPEYDSISVWSDKTVWFCPKSVLRGEGFNAGPFLVSTVEIDERGQKQADGSMGPRRISSKLMNQLRNLKAIRCGGSGTTFFFDKRVNRVDATLASSLSVEDIIKIKTALK